MITAVLINMRGTGCALAGSLSACGRYVAEQCFDRQFRLNLERRGFAIPRAIVSARGTGGRCWAGDTYTASTFEPRTRG
jgi:hypothetical protein